MEDFETRLEWARKGDKDALETLVAENSGLVHFIVRRFENRGCETEDLYQIGCLGLVKAIRRFDCSMGVQFSTYAVPVITGEIKRHLRDDGMVKVSRSIQQNRVLVLRAKEEWYAEYGKQPTICKLQEKTGLSQEDIVLALDASKEAQSLEASSFGEDGEEYVPEIEDKRDAFAEWTQRYYVKELLEHLDPDSRRFVYLRYFGNMTQSSLAKELGVSQVQISRMEKKILERLRKWV